MNEIVQYCLCLLISFNIKIISFSMLMQMMGLYSFMAEKYSIKYMYISDFTYLSSLDKYTFCSLSVINNEVTTWECSYLIDLLCFENNQE